MVNTQHTLFILLFAALNFHILRNLSGLYLALPASLYVLLFLCQLFSWKKNQSLLVSTALFPFAVSLFYIALISSIFVTGGQFYNNWGEVLSGVSRLLFVPIVVFVVAKMSWNQSRIEKVLFTYSLIAAGGSLSLPYQIFFGEIIWFAESSERAGFVRYSSLFGSLTSIGGVAAIGVITTLFLEKISGFQKSLLLICLLTGLALSLQKAALANLVLAIGLSLTFAERINRAVIVKILAGLTLAISLGLPFVPDIENVALATVKNFRFDDSSESTGDVTLGESLIDRTIDRPDTAIKFFGYEYLLTGVGVIGSAGVFGFPEVESTHNSLADSMLTGGVLNLAVLIWLLYFLGREVMRPIPQISVLSSNHYACARAVYFLILLNLPFISGVLFHPNSSILFYFFLGLASAGYFRGEPDRNALRMKHHVVPKS